MFIPKKPTSGSEQQAASSKQQAAEDIINMAACLSMNITGDGFPIPKVDHGSPFMDMLTAG
jgi:hypothetical protein